MLLALSNNITTGFRSPGKNLAFSAPDKVRCLIAPTKIRAFTPSADPRILIAPGKIRIFTAPAKAKSS